MNVRVDEVLYISLEVTGPVKNVTKVLKHCQILEWKKDLLTLSLTALRPIGPRVFKS
jgi:hypothetical protein